MTTNQNRFSLSGSCHCGGITVQVTLTAAPATFTPRKCDCSFCTRHGAAYISDTNGSVDFVLESGDLLRKYRQGENGAADFLMCARCGVLVGVQYADAQGKLTGAVNSAVFDNNPFGEPVAMSPRLLPQEERIERWKKIWIQQVRFVQKNPDGIFPKGVAVKASEVPTRQKPSVYPEPFRSRMAGRLKSQLGDFFGLKNFGVNLTRLSPGAESALFHKHTMQDEFIYVLEGHPTLVTEEGDFRLAPGMCAGFPAGGSAHQLVNRTKDEVIFLEAGDRTKGDEGIYPRDDLKAQMSAEGRWVFTKKDGSSY